MAKKLERPRGFRGYLLNYLHLPWPADVTEVEKIAWLKEYERIFNVKFPEPMSMTPGGSKKLSEPSKVAAPPSVPHEEQTWTGAPYDKIFMTQFKKAVLDSVENELNKASPDVFKRLQGEYYDSGVTVKVKLGDQEFCVQIKPT